MYHVEGVEVFNFEKEVTWIGNGGDLITAVEYFNDGRVEKGFYLFWFAPKCRTRVSWKKLQKSGFGST